MTQEPIYLLFFLKLICILVTSKLVREVITDFDLSKVSGFDYILLVILKDCDPEVSSY